MIQEQFFVCGDPNIILIGGFYGLQLVQIQYFLAYLFLPSETPVGDVEHINPFGRCKQDFIFHFEQADSVVVGISVYFEEVLEIPYLIQLLIDAQAEDSFFRMDSPYGMKIFGHDVGIILGV